MIGYGPYLAGVILTLAGIAPELTGILSLLSFVGFFVLLVMAVLDGTRGPNRFGDDPKGATDAHIFA